MTNSENHFLNNCKETYYHSLTDNILPFWIQYGMDAKNGGIFTCLDRDGTLMDSTKSVWFQGRCAFAYSYAYTAISANQQWLDVARNCIDFLTKHCYDKDGHMFFTVAADGSPIQKRRYVFSECFAAIAYAQYSIASKDASFAKKAIEQLLSIKKMLDTPEFLPAKTKIPSQGHSITMMLINVASIVKDTLLFHNMPHPLPDLLIHESIDRLKRFFMHAEFKALLETVGHDGSFIDTMAGRTINPGHCMETAWFILEEARKRNWDSHLVEMGITIFDWSWDWGWDNQYGGIINFKDCKNFPPQDYSQDMKFWWPQCETIIAALYAYKATGNDKYLKCHQMVHDYAFDVFADKQFPEWYGYLHRDGSVAQPAKGNLFKGPFHIPRMMTKSYLLCTELLK